MSTSRRGFLGFLLAAPVAVHAAVKIATGPAAPLQTLAEPMLPVQGFGLATLKEEGAVLTYAAHPDALWPGIREWWGRQYAESNAPGLNALVEIFENEDG